MRDEQATIDNQISPKLRKSEEAQTSEPSEDSELSEYSDGLPASISARAEPPTSVIDATFCIARGFHNSPRLPSLSESAELPEAAGGLGMLGNCPP